MKLECAGPVLDFPVVYTSAKAGYSAGPSHIEEESAARMMFPYDRSIDHTRRPRVRGRTPPDAGGHHRLLVLFRHAWGSARINGTMSINQPVVLPGRGQHGAPGPDSKLFRFVCDGKDWNRPRTARSWPWPAWTMSPSASPLPTLDPRPLPLVPIDPPTIS